MADVKELNINNTTYDIKAKCVVNTNNGNLKFWSGTSAQAPAIGSRDANTLYNITGDVETEYVNLSLSNANNLGTSRGASWAMPSSTYIDLTLGSTHSTYVAPANGFLVLEKLTNAGSDQIVWLKNISNGYSQMSHTAVSTNTLSASIPMKKGHVAQVDYTAGGAIQVFRFIYAVGSESEAS